MEQDQIHLGYEIQTGAPVSIPIAHMCVTGQTQASGKTTTLQALVLRSGLAAIAFVTKRGEKSFFVHRAHDPAKAEVQIPPFFRPRADWQFVSEILGAILHEKLKFQRSWIMKVCRGAKDLKQVHKNVKLALMTAKGLNESIYTELDAYFELLLPELAALPYSNTLKLAGPKLHIMDLSAYSTALQMLVISSVMTEVYEKRQGVITVIPEAWEFIPNTRTSPVKSAAITMARKGAALRNFLWLDSQDLASVDTEIRKACTVWVLGVQREQNEVKRVLSHIPAGTKRPKLEDIMHLERGQFFVCHGKEIRKVYVQPAWMEAEYAVDIAQGKATVHPNALGTSTVRWKTIKLNTEDATVVVDAREATLNGGSCQKAMGKTEVTHGKENVAALHEWLVQQAAEQQGTIPDSVLDPPLLLHGDSTCWELLNPPTGELSDKVLKPSDFPDPAAPKQERDNPMLRDLPSPAGFIHKYLKIDPDVPPGQFCLLPDGSRFSPPSRNWQVDDGAGSYHLTSPQGENSLDQLERERDERKIRTLEAQLAIFKSDSDADEMAQAVTNLVAERLVSEDGFHAALCVSISRNIGFVDLVAEAVFRRRRVLGNSDVPDIVDQVIKRLPKGPVAVTIEPREYVLRDFQQKEVARLLSRAENLSDWQKNVVRLVESTGREIEKRALVISILGRKTVNMSRDFKAEYKEVDKLVDDGWLRKRGSSAVAPGLTDSICEKLGMYEASEEEINQVVDQILLKLK